ncbi:MAG: tRNA (adenosine(37)-N6)-threonylcarbamoyltransferase complex ATPase subunit type 1 TsaE [Candidatus Zhuqueibacterota bacterium]
MVELFVSYSDAETMAWGEKISRSLRPGDVVAFFGDLGSGKTRTVQGICRGLGCFEQVSSPTFTLINEYSGTFPVYHFDLYRIESEREIYDLGYEEYFNGDGVCLIEWAERIAGLLPAIRIDIFLEGSFEPGQEHIRKIRMER